MGAIRAALLRLLGGTAATAPAVEPVAIPGRPGVHISDMALAEVSAGYGRPLDTWSLPKAAPGVMPRLKVGRMAKDSVLPPMVNQAYAWAMQGAFTEGLGFLGYPYLAELTQRPEYRRVTEIMAREATRKWIKLDGADEAKLDQLEKAFKKYNVQSLFRKMAEHDGFFGRGQLFIDLGDKSDDPELSKPILMEEAKIPKGSLKGFKPVEPLWTYPGFYNSTDPLSPDFYQPQTWYVMGRIIHHTRMLTFTSRPMPDLLKPAYQFGGLALSQMVKPYVDNWLRTRQSVSDLVHSFSTMILKTNMATILAGGAAQSLISRLMMFTRTRDNRGVMAIDKDTEELENVTTPLSSLDALQAQSQEQIASVTGIPLVVLLGVTPSGLNASSDGEIKTFYATVASFQEVLFRPRLQTVLEILQLNEFGQVDPDISFDFIPLWEMDEKDKATIRKSDADMDTAYTTAGIVSAEEVRERIVNDPDSPWFGVDLSAAAPELPDDEEVLAGDDPDEPGPGGKEGGRANDEWKESDHPRRPDGKFGSGGGSGAAAKPKREPHPHVAAILGPDRLARLDELIADKSSKAADILAILKPLDNAATARTPTLPHDKEPDKAFWDSRTYRNKAGEKMNVRAALNDLRATAEEYAGPEGVKRDKQARILLGPPAAGKSTSAEEIARQGGYAIVDGDDAKKVIPEFDGGVGASAVHEESGRMSSLVLDQMLDDGSNVILPLVGASPGSIEKRIARLREAGYNVTVDLVDVKEDEAARRMASRALRSGRHISSGYFGSIGDGPLRTYETLKAKYTELGFGRIDGNGAPRAERYIEAIRHPSAETGRSVFNSGR